MKCVLKICVGNIFSLDVVDAPINMLRCIDVHGIGHENGATLVTSSCGAYTSVENDRHTLVLSVGVICFNLVRGGGLKGHSLWLFAHDGTSKRVGIDDDFSRLLVDFLKIDNDFGVVVPHELVVEGVPALAAVADIDF